ncbi:MFS transporter [Zavarzinella formosa]|uniref:MFS transporter n=1 Tax=Zavarzinella formosa TaxID=360055 RepID=UPI0002FEF140|nr:MFS transporter [Zavarzinella formosa]
MTIPEDASLFRRPYVLYVSGRFFGTLANTSQAVIIAWEVYEIACQSMSVAEASFVVGMIGLAQFLPLFCLTLVAGETADRYNRRLILTLCYLTQLLTSGGLALHSEFGEGLWPIFAISALFGSARAFFQPTASALGPMLVPSELLPRAIATNLLAARNRIGMKMFVAVAVFGLMTLVFACSRSFPLSMACLAVLGGADMVSVFTRQSLVQIATPDRMRGRVSAVSPLFIGASNELGEFESGVAARFLGPVGAVAFGGVGSLLVTGTWVWLFPSLREADRLG